MTLSQLEAALDAGKLQMRHMRDKWYAVRRNGQTRKWTTRPGEFAVPCKVGFNCYLTISHKDAEKDPSDLRIV